MLGKLIKYDLKAAAKIFILLHAMYLFICIAARLFYMDRLSFKRRDGTTCPLPYPLFLSTRTLDLCIDDLHRDAGCFPVLPQPVQ